MARSEHFLRTRDIDWAIKIGNLYVHASSAGDDLPDIVDQNLSEIWDVLKSAEVLYKAEEVQLNDAYLNALFPPQQLVENGELRFRKEWYIHSFRAMAMRGFYSFDRDISTQVGESTYHLVASPRFNTKELNINLPQVEANMTIEELTTCNLVQVINRMTRLETERPL